MVSTPIPIEVKPQPGDILLPNEDEEEVIIIAKSDTKETVAIPSIDTEDSEPENDDFVTTNSIELSLNHHDSYFETSSPMAVNYNNSKKQTIDTSSPRQQGQGQPPRPKSFSKTPTTATTSPSSKPLSKPLSAYQMFAPNDSIYEMNNSMMSMDDLQYVDQSFEQYDKESVVNSGYAASVSALSHSEWSASGFGDSQLSSSYGGGGGGDDDDGGGGGHEDDHEEKNGGVREAMDNPLDGTGGALTRMPSQRTLSRSNIKRRDAEISSDLSTTMSFSILRRARERRRKQRKSQNKKREAEFLVEFRKFMGWNANRPDKEMDDLEMQKERINTNDNDVVVDMREQNNISMHVAPTDGLQEIHQGSSALDRMLSPQFRSMIPWVVINNGNEKEEDLSTLNGSKFNDSHSYNASQRGNEVNCVIEDWNKHADSRLRDNGSALKSDDQEDYAERFYISIIAIAATVVIAMVIVVVLEI